jgi:drug/metabolite transporter (DMT)-like permease
MPSVQEPRQYRGVFILILATFIWGTTFVVTKQALRDFPASALVLARFLIAAVLFIPFLRAGRRLWIAGIELGIWLWLGFATQTAGLKYTSIGRSAFITSLHIIFVPVFAGILGRGSRLMIWIAAATALIGVGLLSNDGSPPNRGDWWTLLCAISFAAYITRLETFTAVMSTASLTAVHLWVVALLSGGWVAVEHPIVTSIPWGQILYLGLAATAMTTWLQTLGQKFVAAPHAAVLYTMEPVWAVFFGWWILNERLGLSGWAGAILIIVAAVLTQRRER